MIKYTLVFNVWHPGVERTYVGVFWLFSSIFLFAKSSKFYQENYVVKPIDVFTFYTLLLFFLELIIRHFSEIKVNSDVIHCKCQDGKLCLYWSMPYHPYVLKNIFFFLASGSWLGKWYDATVLCHLPPESEFTCWDHVLGSSHPPTSLLFEETVLLSGLFHLYRPPSLPLHCPGHAWWAPWSWEAPLNFF